MTIESISVRDILAPIGLMKYKECFEINFGKHCTINKLEKIKIRHLPDMNIRDFDDQLSIMNRLRLVLRRTKTSNKLEKPNEKSDSELDNVSCVQPKSRVRTERLSDASLCSSRSIDHHSRDESRGQRRSLKSRRTSTELQAAFEEVKLMQKIIETNEKNSEKCSSFRRHSLRNTDRKLLISDHNEFLLEATKNEKRDKNSQRRMSNLRERRKSAPSIPQTGILFTQSLSEKMKVASRREKSMYYGLSAQRLAQAELNLNKIGLKVLNNCKNSVACERRSILFVDKIKNELFFFDDYLKRFSLSMDLGISGYVAKNCLLVNTADAYKDTRFNKNLDKETNFTTKSILCAPIQTRVGKCIAVIQMLNKTGGDAFTEEDEEMVKTCSIRVAEALEKHASMLQSAQEDMTNMVQEELNRDKASKRIT